MSRCGQRLLQFADRPFAIARENSFDSSRHLSTACRSASAPHCAVPPVVRIVSRGPAVNNSLHQTTRTSHTSTATKTRIPLMGSSWSWSRGRRSLSVSRQARFRRTRRSNCGPTVVSGWVSPSDRSARIQTSSVPVRAGCGRRRAAPVGRGCRRGCSEPGWPDCGFDGRGRLYRAHAGRRQSVAHAHWRPNRGEHLPVGGVGTICVLESER